MSTAYQMHGRCNNPNLERHVSLYLSQSEETLFTIVYLIHAPSISNTQMLQIQLMPQTFGDKI